MTSEEIDFIQTEQKKMKTLAGLPRADQIKIMCDWAGCTPQRAAKHFQAYVHQSWNVHPSARFRRWWEGGGFREVEEQTGRGWSVIGTDNRYYGTNTITACNCEPVRVAYRAFQADQDALLRWMKSGKRGPAPTPVERPQPLQPAMPNVETKHVQTYLDEQPDDDSINFGAKG